MSRSPPVWATSPQPAGMVGHSTSEKWPFLSNILVRSDLGMVSLCGIVGTSVDKTEWSKLVLREKRWIIVTSGVCMCVCMCVYTCVRACAQSCPTLCSPMDCSPPGSSVHGIFRPEHWSGLPPPTPGDLPGPGIKPMSLVSPALAGGFFTTVPPGKPRCYIIHITIPLPHYSCISLICYIQNFFIFYR